MSVIKVDYSRALASAAKLERAAAQCGATANRARNTYAARLEDCWTGASGAQAHDRLLGWCQDMRAAEQELSVTAQAIRRVVRQLQEAEQRAAAAAAAAQIAKDAAAELMKKNENVPGASGGGCR